MMWRDLPPVGHSIVLSGEATDLPVFAGYHGVWVNSGTAALALAFFLARQRRPDIAQPEVVLPGYGCPDLVAAAVYAGVRPVLADIGADDPGYDLDSLRAALSANTVAVVAVNFLGIQERLAELRSLLNAWPGVALIEDDAQWFPEPIADSTLTGDAVCLSFGRGKPVSLLGGGALFVRGSFVSPGKVDLQVAPFPASTVGLRWKMRAYNFLLNPWVYGLLSRNPLLNLGRTVFKPLQGITPLDRQRRDLLPPNINRYLARPSNVAERIHGLLPAAMDLPARLGERAGRLLRYPVLCEDLKQRNGLWAALRRSGLGPSAMYQRPLPEIEGVQGKVEVRGELRGARRFADRLLTLPVHEGVDARSIRKMKEILNR